MRKPKSSQSRKDTNLNKPSEYDKASYRFVALEWLGGNLSEGGGITLMVVIINIVLQVGVFLFNVHEIINNYYDPALQKEDPIDYLLHHICFFTFVTFESLSAGLILWATIHGCSSIVRTLCSFCPCNADTNAPEKTVPKDVEANQPNQPRTPEVKLVPRLINLLFGIWCEQEAMLIGLCETVLFVICVLEAKLLADMAVHFIDLDLVDVMGLKTVLERQHQLGAGIADEHWPYIKIVVFLLFTGQLGVYYLAKYLNSKLSSRQKAKAFFTLVFLSLTLFAVAPHGHRILAQRQSHFRSLLPFNFFDREVTQDLVPVQPRVSYAFPPRPGEGYPVVKDAHSDIPRLVGNRRNIIVLAQESFRRSELANFSPKTRTFVNEHKCIEPKLGIPGGHVTEMSWFSILYGLYAYHHHSFNINHLTSYPLDVLKGNDYVTTLITASICWPYPNKNIFSNFQELYSDENNEEVFTSISKFIENRKQDQKNFFLYLTLHKTIEEYRNDPEYLFHLDNTAQKNRSLLRDRDRMDAINMFKTAGLLDNTLLFIVADHGDMKGEHGEQGHGQKEGSWWNEKALIPYFACFMGNDKEADMDRYHRTPQLASLVDIVPTWMGLLQWDKPLQPAAYSNGMSIAIPKEEEDYTENRTVVASARYFPQKNKINALISREEKLWFRVDSFNPTNNAMKFRPEYLTDTKDELLEGCNLASLQKSISNLHTVAEVKEGQESEVDAACKAIKLGHKLKDFHNYFWQFFELKT